MRLTGNGGKGRSTIQDTIHLRARPLHGGTFLPVEQAELYPCTVGYAAHQAIQRIDFSHQMTFAQPANGGIAGQGSNVLFSHRHQGSFSAQTAGGSRSFKTGMPSTDNDDLILFHVKHLFPDAEGCEDHIQIILGTDSAKQTIQ